MTTQPTYTSALENPIFQTLQTAVAAWGHPTFVIGGFVRDFILGRKLPNDIDIVTVGDGMELAQQVAQLLPKQPPVQTFKNFGTAMIKTKAFELEFVGARKESYQRDSRKPKVSAGSLEDDQNRRDFTINALAISLNQEDFGALVDPFDGQEDLNNKLIRTPLDPDLTFSDDPLRMLRAIRFASQLKFTIAPTTFESIQRNAARLAIISRERCVDELHKILSCDQPSAGLLLLDKAGLLDQILPEVTALKGIEEIEGHRHKDNFYHTFEVVDNIAQYTDNLWLRWAALLHDIGKAPTKKFKPPTGWTFHGHEFVGAKMVYRLFKRLKMPLNDKMKYVQKLVLMSSRPIVIAEDIVTDAAVRRLIFDAGDILEDLIILCKADITTKNPKRFQRYHKNFEIVKAKIEDVEARDHIRNFQPPISGEYIMKSFHLKPSREIGIIKETIKEAILEGEIPNEFEAALQLMITKGKALGLTYDAEAV
ncbi:MAG: CCA tRNA nucleotidyltransferase [Flavobacteriaceae bacterium]